MPEFREEEIDFSDLEKQYEVNPDDGMESFVVIDGIPVVDDKKFEALSKVIKKKLTKDIGKIKDDGFFMPKGEDGLTKGYVFVEYETPEQADTAIRTLNFTKLDKKHTFLVNKLGDIERYAFAGKVATEYVEPEITEYKPREHLRDWLTDSQGRDQFLVQRQKDIMVFWNKKAQDPEPAVDADIEPPIRTQTYSVWSPKGSYIATFHLEGVQIRGGASFSILGQFPHLKPESIEFSPSEKYAITISREPIALPPADDPRRAKYPFQEKDEGNHVVVWDVATCLPLRTFPVPGFDPKNPQRMPKFKWSADEKYFARVLPDTLQVYETPSMGLVDKKSIKVSGIVDFEFAPAPILLDGRKEETSVLCYWTPELSNQTARVSLMEIPSKEVIRSVNLFNVSGCRIHWQNDGKFLCVKVDRHTKTKKSTFTNLEFFRLTEKNIPVEVIELKETVVNFAWEPHSDRFVILSRPDVPGPSPAAAAGLAAAAPAAAQSTVSFYALERNKGIQGTWKLLNKLEKQSANAVHWSPRGRFVAIGNQNNASVKLDFYDFDHEGEKKEDMPCNLHAVGSAEHYGMTNLQWDPSGRFVATWSSAWKHRVENGYKIWDFRGALLREDSMDHFNALAWRPRPESLLTKQKKKQVTKNLKQYSRQFDEEDAMEASEANRELILRRRRAIEEWKSWREEMEARLSNAGLTPESQIGKESNEGDEYIEEITEEVLDEQVEEM
ncbi:eukaryotic translation initiation factor 3 subunit B [Trichomonascus vanleenenianus]|uniref:translation initiation factor eIF3 core subunit b n=1 Tax=Trichomonascus vanleenenianus TaxID=2268995 RepID=UPI003ECA3B22